MATHANSTPAPKIDRSALMRAAWAHLKGWYSARRLAFRLIRADLAYALRCALHDARLAQVAPRHLPHAG